MTVYNLFNNMIQKIDGGESWHSSSYAKRLHELGTVLTTPTSYWLKGLSRAFILEFKPGWWNQKESKNNEMLYRGGLSTVLAATSPFVALSTLFGAPMRAIASYWKRDFVLQKPLSENQSVDADEENPQKQIRVLSFNTLLMPEFLVTRNKQRPTWERVHEVAQAILDKKQANAPDVVCLQEVFHTGAAEILAQKLRKAGYHVIYNVGHKTMGLNSGLFMASKHGFDNVEFFEHPSLKVGADRYANKGVLLATTQMNGKTYVVGNTHLNGGGKEGAVRSYTVRALQVLAMKSHIQKYANHLNSDLAGIIMSGDTNITPTDHDNPRDLNNQNRKTPKCEPEWWLSYEIEKIDLRSELSSHSWEAFTSRVNQVFEEIDRACRYNGQISQMRFEGDKLKKLLNKKEGGPFGSTFKHDVTPNFVRNGQLYNWAIKGTTIDTDASKHVGFGRDLIEQPERVDYVTVRKAYQTEKRHRVDEPILKKIQIFPMTNSRGQFCSDHLAVLATLEPANSLRS